jgi:sugar diacid utilization regulator
MLVATLAAWLEHGQRLADTAAALYVHPNTVRHRLGRLRRAGVDVDVVGVRAATSLWWACRALVDLDRPQA